MKSRDERKKDAVRFIPSTLLIVSFFTHVSQLFIYGHNLPTLIVAAFGAFYLLISVFIFLGYRYAPYAGSVVPAIGASLGIYRFLTIIPSPFSIFNVALDAIIVPFSIVLIWRWLRGS